MITGTFSVDGGNKSEVEEAAEAQLLTFMGHPAQAMNSDFLLSSVDYDIAVVPMRQDPKSWRITRWQGEVTFKIW